MTRSLGGEVAKDLGDVFALCTEGCGAGGPDGIVAQDMTVLLHGGTASRSVDDDGVDVDGFKRGDHLTGELCSLIFEAGVDHQGAAARLRLRDEDVTTFSGEDAGCGLVDMLEEDLLDAAGEHADTAPRSIRCGNLRREMLEQICGN